MQQNQTDMGAVIAGLTTKSDKIRALKRARFTRRQIADFLGIKYQHVWNVLKADSHAGAQISAAPISRVGISDNSRSFEPALQTAQRITVGKDGEVRIPQVMLDAAGVKEGEVLLVRFDDGDIRLYTPVTVSRRLQAKYRALVPEGVSLADELIAERRQEAEREHRGE